MKQKKGGEKRSKASRILSTAVVILLAVVGLALILYPTVADRINQAMNGEAIEEYRRKAQAVDSNDYQEMLDAAREYNAALAEKTPYIGELTQEKRELYESLLDLTGNGIIGYIEVPKTKIYLAVYHGTGESVLQTGVGHLEASSLPVTGESVHTVLTGHSGLPSARLFTDLDQLEIGDTFTLYVLNETLTYRVEEMKRVLPEELENLRIEEGQELCTLLTCTPYGVNTHRLAVTGRRIETPSTETDEQTAEILPVKQALTSGWNWKFIILPPIVLAGMIVAVVLIRRKIRRRKKAMSGGSDPPARDV